MSDIESRPDLDALRAHVRDCVYGLRHQPEISREDIADVLERAALAAPATGDSRPSEGLREAAAAFVDATDDARIWTVLMDDGTSSVRLFVPDAVLDAMRDARNALRAALAAPATGDSRPGLDELRETLIKLIDKHCDIGEYGSGASDPEGLADAILDLFASPANGIAEPCNCDTIPHDRREHIASPATGDSRHDYRPDPRKEGMTDPGDCYFAGCGKPSHDPIHERATGDSRPDLNALLTRWRDLLIDPMTADPALMARLGPLFNETQDALASPATGDSLFDGVDGWNYELNAPAAPKEEPRE